MGSWMTQNINFILTCKLAGGCAWKMTQSGSGGLEESNLDVKKTHISHHFQILHIATPNKMEFARGRTQIHWHQWIGACQCLTKKRSVIFTSSTSPSPSSQDLKTPSPNWATKWQRQRHHNHQSDGHHVFLPFHSRPISCWALFACQCLRHEVSLLGRWKVLKCEFHATCSLLTISGHASQFVSWKTVLFIGNSWMGQFTDQATVGALTFWQPFCIE